MKKILFFFVLFAVTLAMTGCSDDDYTIDEAYEKAEITSITMYDKTGTNVNSKITVDSEAGTVLAIIKAGSNIKELKMVANISAGATLTPGMAVGLRDYTSPTTYTVTSPGKKVVKQWIVTVQVAP